MKKILYLLPFILYTVFYLLIIIVEGTIENLVMPDVLLLLILLLFVGLGTLSEKKLLNGIGIISLFIISFALIKMGIENNYFSLAETKIAIAILLYYLIVFIINRNKELIIMNAIVIEILLLSCNGGLFHWSKTVDGENIMTIGDSFINPVYMTYKDNLIIIDDNIVNIDTSYNISNVKLCRYSYKKSVNL